MVGWFNHSLGNFFTSLNLLNSSGPKMTPGEPVKFAKACHKALNEVGMLLITKCNRTDFLVT